MSVRDPETRQQMVDRSYAIAYEFEQKYGSCPQCVLSAIQQVFEIGSDDVLKASHVLAGGGGLTRQGTCGALVGAMMAVSVKYGRDGANLGNGLYMDSFALAKQIFNRFVAEFGSPICGDVQTKVLGQSYDFWTPKEFAAFEAAGGHVDKCPRVGGAAARIAAEVLLEAEEKARMKDAR